MLDSGKNTCPNIIRICARTIITIWRSLSNRINVYYSKLCNELSIYHSTFYIASKYRVLNSHGRPNNLAQPKILSNIPYLCLCSGKIQVQILFVLMLGKNPGTNIIRACAQPKNYYLAFPECPSLT